MARAGRVRRVSGLAAAFVLALLLVLGALVYVQVSGTHDETPYKRTQIQLRLIESNVLSYREDTGDWPVDLNALTFPGGNGPYLSSEQVNDPWGHAVVYRVAADGRGFELTILGRDGRPGGKDGAADTRLTWPTAVFQ